MNLSPALKSQIIYLQNEIYSVGAADYVVGNEGRHPSCSRKLVYEVAGGREGSQSNIGKEQKKHSKGARILSVNARVPQMLLQSLLVAKESNAGLTVEGRGMRW